MTDNRNSRDFLDTDIMFLKGVGSARGKALGDNFDIHTFRDLLYNFPYRYVDKSRFYKISEFLPDMPLVQVKGKFVNFVVEGEGMKRRLSAAFYDGERFFTVMWFHRIDAIKTAYKPGVEYIIFGKPVMNRGGYAMYHPEVSVYDPASPPKGFEGIYSVGETAQKKGWSSRQISKLVANLLEHSGYAAMTDPLPEELRSRYSLPGAVEAFREMHFPTNPERLQKARERMKFEELYYLELNILRYTRERGKRIKGEVFSRIGEKFNGFYNTCLPFDLTGAQKRVLKEIRADMKTGRQMNRLLQGDVGSGKTMVAFMTMLMALDNDCQAVIMAPTEILAHQHYDTMKEWCDCLGIEIRLLTGSTRTKSRRETLEGLKNGSVNIAVGTHALIEERVEFCRLGVAVIDEQHRFGVAQRAKLWSKGVVAPHVLVMTATPIPRTLAMTVYGDLDVSVIDELPPGRKPVQTYLRGDGGRMEVNRLIHRELKAGRQIYFVYPLIKENEKLALKSLEEGYRSVCDEFKDYRVAFVHGKMKPAEKDYQMGLFVDGTARIMVATTVIEVGVNVPNASVMVIESAERFGLSQLHQLRGRVGRGAEHSYCLLMSRDNIGGDTKRRLQIMTETSDGFLISEADMKMRGPGDMEGTQQSGIAFNLRVANLARDGQIVTVARQAAEMTLNAHPELTVASADSSCGKADLLPLSPLSLTTVARELRRRFAKDVDWSMIS